MCFKDRVWFGLCHFLVIAHVILLCSTSTLDNIKCMFWVLKRTVSYVLVVKLELSEDLTTALLQRFHAVKWASVHKNPNQHQ